MYPPGVEPLTERRKPFRRGAAVGPAQYETRRNGVRAITVDGCPQPPIRPGTPWIPPEAVEADAVVPVAVEVVGLEGRSLYAGATLYLAFLLCPLRAFARPRARWESALGPSRRSEWPFTSIDEGRARVFSGRLAVEPGETSVSPNRSGGAPLDGVCGAPATRLRSSSPNDDADRSAKP